MEKTIYNYHPETGEFLSAAEADPSPLEDDVWLIPAHATDIAPPQADRSAHQIAVFDNEWVIKPDWRDVPLYSTVDGAAVSIRQIGQVPADVSATEVSPPSPAHSWQKGKWVEDPAKKAALLAELKAARTQKIKADCAAAIVAGFNSSALGAEHHYPSGDPDQRDLLNAALASQDQPATWSAMLWCAAGTPLAWNYEPHTAAQVRQVNADWLAYRQAQQQKYAGLIGQINEAATEDAVQEVSW
ncbi:hypothetical protein RSSE_c3303 [Ralstonia solanacearum]|nr:hypothetical protein RSSE_c3303 [Ralstonia solanacearum]